MPFTNVEFVLQQWVAIFGAIMNGCVCGALTRIIQEMDASGAALRVHSLLSIFTSVFSVRLTLY